MTDLSVDRATLPGTRVQVLEAAEAALAWFDRFDAPAPEGLAFGGEAKVRKQLRAAIRGAWAEADALAWVDAADADEAEALDELRVQIGRVPTDKERAAFLEGFREVQKEHSGRG